MASVRHSCPLFERREAESDPRRSSMSAMVICSPLTQLQRLLQQCRPSYSLQRAGYRLQLQVRVYVCVRVSCRMPSRVLLKWPEGREVNKGYGRFGIGSTKGRGFETPVLFTVENYFKQHQHESSSLGSNFALLCRTVWIWHLRCRGQEHGDKK